MKAIPASSFIMGSEANDAEKPPHKVELGPVQDMRPFGDQQGIFAFRGG